MKIINDLNYPEAFIQAITDNTVPPPDQKVVRVTELIDSPMIYYLRRKYWDKLEAKASDLQSALIGWAFHKFMSTYGSGHVEERLELKIGNWTVTGQPDCWTEEGILLDWKTTRVWSYLNVKVEWEAQTNVYAYLIYKLHGIQIKQIDICAVFLDYLPSHAGQPDMPPARFVRMPQPVWPITATEAYIYQRLVDLELGRPCTDAEKWLDKECWLWYPDKCKNGIKFYSYAELQRHVRPGDRVVHRPAKARRCEGYCPVARFCKEKCNEQKN